MRCGLRATLLAPCALLLVIVVASGCAGSGSPGKTMSDWFGGDSADGNGDELVYYAAVEGLEVRAEPGASSKLVGKLRLHEKVTRKDERKGYSLIRAGGGKVEGWVLSTRLIWRVPQAAAGSAASQATATKGSTPAVEVPGADATDPGTGEKTVEATIEPSAPDVAEVQQEEVEASEPAAASPSPAPPPPEPASRKKGVGASVFDPY